VEGLLFIGKFTLNIVVESGHWSKKEEKIN
jgi:hypothetical protein